MIKVETLTNLVKVTGFFGDAGLQRFVKLVDRNDCSEIK